MARATTGECIMGITEKRLCQRINRAAADAQIVRGARGRQHLDWADPHRFQQADGLFFNHIRQRTDQQQLALIVFW